MSLKKKLILIGICVGIIFIVFTVNVIRRLTTDTGKKQDFVVNENIITRAEAFRLISYLEYDKAKRESLQTGIVYADHSMSDWYDTYLNAVWKMGLIEGNIKVNPKEALTYGTCKELVDKLIIKEPRIQDIYQLLSFNFLKAEEEMPIIDFLELYDAIRNTIANDSSIIEEVDLFVIGKDVSDSGLVRMITDKGKFFYKDAVSYERFYDIDEESDFMEGHSDLVEAYLDAGITAMVSGQEIIYVTMASKDKYVLRNVWIKTGKEQLVDTFISGVHREFSAKFPLSTNIEKVVGDITIENKKVVQISVKPEIISGKVLLSGEDFIEIAGYGKIPLDDDYRIYKIYGELSLEPTNSILVGYETTDFVVSNGKISAAIIKESIKAENIRVLLKTNNFEKIYHNSVEFTVSSDFVISDLDNEYSYSAGERITVKPGDSILSEGRIKITPSSDQGKIQLFSIERSYGNPKYRGTFEIAETDKGLIIINELSLEEYLYAVIPSEMPTFYGVEALKVQAVCARSYAYKHLLANSLSSYGAHVDDSISYQVYNNIEENETSILAVKDTYGKVIKYNDEVITAYYFSTSCGHTTAVEHVWTNGVATPYLTGRLVADEAVTAVSLTEDSIYRDLSIEENFRSFITDDTIKTYDSGFNWYRWKVTMDVEDIKKVIDSKIRGRYNANPDLVQILVRKQGSESVFESIPIDTIGTIQDISVLKRETGGIITELLITGSSNTVKIKTEFNIRALLAPTYSTMIRKDESQVNNLGFLPSAFFVIDKNMQNGALKSITLIGGGYGHGVGMSQNGVKAMTDEGKTYEEIVEYFYRGTNLGFIY